MRKKIFDILYSQRHRGKISNAEVKRGGGGIVPIYLQNIEPNVGEKSRGRRRRVFLLLGSDDRFWQAQKGLTARGCGQLYFMSDGDKVPNEPMGSRDKAWEISTYGLSWSGGAVRIDLLAFSKKSSEFN